MRKTFWLACGLALALWVMLARMSPPASASGRLALTETTTPLPTDTATPPAPATPSPTPTSTTVPASPPPATPAQQDPLITKRVDLAQAVVGDEVLFTITVLNPGDIEITGVSVTDPLPALLDFVQGATSLGALTYDAATHTVQVEIGTLAPHHDATITIRARVNQLGQPPDIITNLAYIGDTPSNPVDVSVVPPGLPTTGFGPGPRERWLLVGLVGLSLTIGLGLAVRLRRLRRR